MFIFLWCNVTIWVTHMKWWNQNDWCLSPETFILSLWRKSSNYFLLVLYKIYNNYELLSANCCRVLVFGTPYTDYNYYYLFIIILLSISAKRSLLCVSENIRCLHFCPFYPQLISLMNSMIGFQKLFVYFSSIFVYYIRFLKRKWLLFLYAKTFLLLSKLSVFGFITFVLLHIPITRTQHRVKALWTEMLTLEILPWKFSSII